MTIQQKPNIFKLFFILNGSIIPKIYPKLIFFTLLGGFVTIIQHYYIEILPAYAFTPFTLVGIAMSLFLGFRNNACYDRWWEARKQWGQLIVDCRSLSRQMKSFIDIESDAGKNIQKRMIYIIIAFSHTLRLQLTDSAQMHKIEQYIKKTNFDYLDKADIDGLKKSSNKADYLLGLAGKILNQCLKQNILSDILVKNFDARLTSMASVQASCERIKNTPLPIAYILLVQRTAYIYCFLLPFGVVVALDFFTPVFCLIVAYTFFGLDALSEALEIPFDENSSNFSLEKLTENIETGLLESIQ